MTKIYDLYIRKSLIASTALVEPGSSVPMVENISANFGTTATDITISTTNATMMTAMGYIIAPLTMAFSFALFSSWLPRRTIQVSRLPDSSPAATMFVNMLSKTFGDFAIASARVSPCWTFSLVLIRAFFRVLFAVCSASILSASTTVTPAERTLEN